MKYFNTNVDDVIKSLDSKSEGLTESEVKKRLTENGKNKLNESPKKTIIVRFLEQLKNVMIIVLIIAAALSCVVSIIENEPITDTIIIICVVLLNAILGLMQESKADKAITALQKMSVPFITVKRGGKVTKIKTEELVVGDMVILEAGNYVPADLRIIESHSLRVVEAALTGESEPIDKVSEILNDEKLPLADRINMLYSGSDVIYGRGLGIVTATGMNTELGKIATSLVEIKAEETPLQKKMKELSKTLSVIVIFIAIFMFIIGLIQGNKLIDVFMFAIALAVAAIPEGLATVITISLAIGVENMSKKNSIVRKLSSVEALGCTEVICSDKTGTLTQNKMSVRKIVIDNEIYDFNKDSSNEKINRLLHAMILCNDTMIDDDKLLGDPTETSLFAFAKDRKINLKTFIDTNKRIHEIPFDSNRKMMSTINKSENEISFYTKGSLESVLECCTKIEINNNVRKITTDDKVLINKINNDLSSQALRVLAFAYKTVSKEKNKEREKEENLTFIGLVAVIDPPRKEVKDAVEKCYSSGIVPVMITGDNIITAKAIASEINIYTEKNEAITGTELDLMSEDELVNRLENIRVYARVSPENKIRIVKAWKSLGKTVAMTGDGVNDAPALKGADIGIGMGITGTEVSKSVSSMVLADDNFATIVTAVAEGRRIYNNIQNAITYLLASNLCEILIILLGMFLLKGDYHILLPVQILWVNLISDTVPALALAFEKPEKNIMELKPRSQKEPFFTKFITTRIITSAVIKFIALTIIYIYICNHYNHVAASSAVFVLLSIIEILYAMTCRSDRYSLKRIGIFSNSIMTYCVIGTLSLQFLMLSNSVTRSWLSVENLNSSLYPLIIIVAIITFLILEINKIIVAKIFNKK